MGSSSVETRPSWRYLLLFVLVYFFFGVAYQITVCLYSGYRAAAGNPSDLPCAGFPWTPMILACWPLFAFGTLIAGKAALLSGWIVRAWGAVFLAGFVLVMWLLRDRSPGP